MSKYFMGDVEVLVMEFRESLSVSPKIGGKYE